MKNKRVKLKPKQVKYLKVFKNQGKKSVREINRANILLLLNKGKKTPEITDFLDIGRNTVSRIKQKFLKHGLETALKEDERSGQPLKYKQKHKAELIALACSDPPEGRTRWTLELMTEKLKL